MKLNLSYKSIHIGAIATFYIIALLVRLYHCMLSTSILQLKQTMHFKFSQHLPQGLVLLSEHWWLCLFSNVKRNTLS